MMVYMKICIKFPHAFWSCGPGKEVFIYAHERRGYYTFLECVEKLRLLSTPEERQRKLDEIPEVHADPTWIESEDESEPEKGQALHAESNIRPRETSSLWRERGVLPIMSIWIMDQMSPTMQRSRPDTPL